MYCKNCGKELKDGTSFCTACGSPVLKALKGKGEQKDIKRPVLPHEKQKGKALFACAACLALLAIGGFAYSFAVKKSPGTVQETQPEAERKISELAREEEPARPAPEPETERKPEEPAPEPPGLSGEEQAGQEMRDEVENSAAEEMESRLIKDQSFETELHPLGAVTFLSYVPEDDWEPPEFIIEQNGTEILSLSSGKTDEGEFCDVEEVYFRDYNGDGMDDIMINCRYEDLDDDSEYMVCQIYRGSAEGKFYYQKTLSEIASASACERGSMWNFGEELVSRYQTEDLPYSNSRDWNREDLMMLTKEQLRLARNEIYARHGYAFEDSGLNQHFQAREWYRPLTGEVPDTELNNYEIHNRDLILELEGESGT